MFTINISAILGLDPFLLILAQSGMFVYCMFSMIGSHHTQHHQNSSGLTLFFSEFLSLNQVGKHFECSMTNRIEELFNLDVLLYHSSWLTLKNKIASVELNILTHKFYLFMYRIYFFEDYLISALPPHVFKVHNQWWIQDVDLGGAGFGLRGAEPDPSTIYPRSMTKRKAI